MSTSKTRPGYFNLPATHAGEAPDARRFRLRYHTRFCGHELWIVTRLSDRRSFSIAEGFPWLVGKPVDCDSWCAHAFHHCTRPWPKHGFTSWWHFIWLREDRRDAR